MNVVYKINCCDCDASYVKQTGTKLKTRLSEHQKHIVKHSPHSMITDHRLQNDHDFNWQNVEILENYYNKRLISELMLINQQTNGLNLQHDNIQNVVNSTCFISKY